MSKGRLIALEGPDGSGKTTQARRLAEHLKRKGWEVVQVEEPGGTAVGDRIREILLDRHQRLEPLTELLLYEASRSQLVREVIRPALKEGRVVIIDRYMLSSIAYQGYGRKLQLELVKELNRIATGDLEPELTILFDLPPEEGLSRKRGKDRLEVENLEFHRRVRQGYLDWISQNNESSLLIDATQPIEVVFREILNRLEEIEFDR
ncbi:MAG: dTMP kinase [Candidatus Bipolaricaulia bacterium]